MLRRQLVSCSLALCVGLLAQAGQDRPQAPVAALRTSTTEFQVARTGYVCASLIQDGEKLTLDDPAEEAGDRLWVNGALAPTTVYGLKDATRTEFRSRTGVRAQRLTVRTRVVVAGVRLDKTLTVEARADLPNLVVISLRYTNTGRREAYIDRIEFGRRRLNAALVGHATRPFDAWTFQGASRKWGEGEVSEMDAKFERANRMGVVQGPEGEGGGIPVVAFWTRRIGVAVGHVEPVPLVLSLPVHVARDGRIETAIALEPAIRLKSGQSYRTPRGFVSVFSGDFYEALRAYAQALPLVPGAAIPEAYETAWCGWGYRFDVTPTQMLGTMPKLKELDIHWATLDDGWFQTYGDWQPRPDTFPDNSLPAMVDSFHRQGFRVQLWWYPLAVEDGQGRYESHKYRVATVVEHHPEWLILDRNGKHARFGRDLAVLCPALPEVQQYHRLLTAHFLRDWGFDGHKLDVAYSVPPCYNSRHRHSRPEESIEAMGKVYRAIYETSLELKPDSVIQICPCGTTPNVAWLPYLNQAVAADPVGSPQVRQRIKMYKALLGPRAAVTGDHVEYTAADFTGTDFASTVGLGGIPGTRFTWPGPGPWPNSLLDAAEGVLFRRWFGLYESRRLSTGEFRNLYVYGYDRPEGYAVEKDGNMYYAFFAERWRGEVELRGLKPGRYRVSDYVAGADLGVVDAAFPKLRVDFSQHLLLEASLVR